MKQIITIILAFIALHTNAQEISGKVLNENNEPVVIGAVLVKQNGVLKGGACSDYDGSYIVKPLEPGYYDITVYYGCYDTVTITKVAVGAGQKTFQNFNLTQSSGSPRHTVQPYKKLLTDDIHNGAAADMDIVRDGDINKKTWLRSGIYDNI